MTRLADDDGMADVNRPIARAICRACVRGTCASFAVRRVAPELAGRRHQRRPYVAGATMRNPSSLATWMTAFTSRSRCRPAPHSGEESQEPPIAASAPLFLPPGCDRPTTSTTRLRGVTIARPWAAEPYPSAAPRRNPRHLHCPSPPSDHESGRPCAWQAATLRRFRSPPPSTMPSP